MVILRHSILYLLTFFNVGVLASNLSSQDTRLADIPPCGVSRSRNENNHAKVRIDSMHISRNTDQRLLIE
jgi:hypothetical protein